MPFKGVGTGQVVSVDLGSGTVVSGSKEHLVFDKKINHNYNSGNDVLLKGRVLHLIS
jgi:hypothetical protein